MTSAVASLRCLRFLQEWRTLDAIAEEFDCSVRTAKRRLADIREAGYTVATFTDCGWCDEVDTWRLMPFEYRVV